MKSKSKFIIALVLFGVVTIGAIAGIIAVVASFNANVESNFKVSYTAQNVHATVSAGYVVSEEDTEYLSDLTYTPIKAGGAEQIEFNAGDEAEEVEKSFDGLTLDIKKNQYVYFKYTFTHTGDETNSMKFLNIALTKDFTQFENLTMEYGIVSDEEFETISWNPVINELTAVRGEDNVTDVYIKMYVTTKTKDAKLDGMLNWNLTGSEEYVYENAYMEGINLAYKLYDEEISPTSVTFDYLNEDNQSIIASATTTIPVYSDGSYGVNAYVVGTDVYVLSEYNIVAHDCWSMFYNLSELTDIIFNNFDTSKTANMFEMFAGCTGLTSIDLSGLDTSKVTNMSYMFRGCTGLTSIDLSGLYTSNVTYMGSMFYGCTGLTSIDLSGLDTSKVTDMSYMFRGCTGLTEVNLTGLDTSNVTSMWDMFSGCTNLVTIYADESFNTSKVEYSTNMFYKCTSLVGGNGTVYDSTKVDYTYARIDKAGTPGYFTEKPVV